MENVNSGFNGAISGLSIGSSNGVGIEGTTSVTYSYTCPNCGQAITNLPVGCTSQIYCPNCGSLLSNMSSIPYQINSGYSASTTYPIPGHDEATVEKCLAILSERLAAAAIFPETALEEFGRAIQDIRKLTDKS